MTGPKAKPFNQKKGYDRQLVCREVRLPEGYWTPGRPGRDKDGKKTPGKKTWITVPLHISKAVVKDIANNDWPGSQNYKSNENIAWATGLPLRSIAKGVAVLKSAGILRRTQREGKTYSHLNWDLMQTLREKFVTAKVDDKPDPDVPDDFDDELEPLKPEDAEDDVSPSGPSAETGDTALSLIDIVMGFEPYRHLRPAVETVIKGLLKTKSPEKIRTAWESLDDRQKAHVVSTAKNPGGYLRSMLANAIDQPHQEPEPDDDYDWVRDGGPAFMEEVIGIARIDGSANINLKGHDADMVQSYSEWIKKWCDLNAPEVEYEVDLPSQQIRISAGSLAR